MLRELVTKSPLLGLPLGVLLLFFGVFVFTIARTYWRRASAYEALASLPLDKDHQDHE